VTEIDYDKMKPIQQLRLWWDNGDMATLEEHLWESNAKFPVDYGTLIEAAEELVTLVKRTPFVPAPNGIEMTLEWPQIRRHQAIVKRLLGDTDGR